MVETPSKFPIGLNMWPPKFLPSPTKRGLRSLKGHITLISFSLKLIAFLLFSNFLDHINPKQH